jgi:hypothetical protein
MLDHSNGKHLGWAVVETQEGFQVGEVGRRFTGRQVVVKQHVGVPCERVEDALASLEEVHARHLEDHVIGSHIALGSIRRDPRLA